MIEKELKNFDIGQIAASGQCFRMETPDSETGHVSLIASDKYLEIRRISQTPGSHIYEFSCTEKEFSDFWNLYFDLDYDYNMVKRLVPDNDCYLKNAVSFGGGIRILRQDLWETVISFLISQQNNIPRIRRCIRLLCEAYGRPCETPSGQIYYSFPSPESLASASLEELKNCNLGYRGKYILQTARDVSDGTLSLEAIRSMNYTDARNALMSCYGIGVKVADCICLFALHHIEAFPVDTHIRQVLEREYPDGFPLERYPGCAGILQQYIFFYELFRPKF